MIVYIEEPNFAYLDMICFSHHLNEHSNGNFVFREQIPFCSLGYFLIWNSCNAEDLFQTYVKEQLFKERFKIVL